MVNQQYNPYVFQGIITKDGFLTYSRFKIIIGWNPLVKYLLFEKNIDLEYSISPSEQDEQEAGLFLSDIVKHPCYCKLFFKGDENNTDNPSIHQQRQKTDLELQIWIDLKEITFDVINRFNKKPKNYLILRAIKEFPKYPQEDDTGIYTGLFFGGINPDLDKKLLTADSKTFLEATRKDEQKHRFELWADYEFKNLK